MITAKRNAKGYLFTGLFGDEDYLFKPYQSLHPEDKEATVDMLQSATIQNITEDSIELKTARQIQ